MSSRLSKLTTQRNIIPDDIGDDDSLRVILDKVKSPYKKPKTVSSSSDDSNTDYSSDEDIQETIDEILPVPSPLKTAERLDIEQDLINLGVNPQEKIVITGDIKAVKYIKGMTNNGIPILVDVNVDGLVTVRSKDLVVRESKKVIETPISNYLSAYKIPFEIEGIATQVPSGIIAIERNSNFEPISKTLVTESEPTTAQGTLCNKANVCEVLPIIKLSDLKANPKLVLDQIDLQSRSIRNELFVKASENFHQTKEDIVKLNHSYQQAVQLIPQTATELSTSIQKLQDYAQKFNELGLVESNPEMYQSLLNNLKIRNNLVSKLISITSILANVDKHIQQATNQINGTIDMLHNDFNQLNYDLSS